MKRWLLFCILPFLLSGNEPVRIAGKYLSGWGCVTPQGIMVPAHVLFGDDTWVCPLGEPEKVLIDTARDLVVLQSREYPVFPGIVRFPPGELPSGEVTGFTEDMVFLKGIDTNPGDSGRPLLDKHGCFFAVILGRIVRGEAVETIAARLDIPVAGEVVSAGEFRCWNRKMAHLCRILKTLEKENCSDPAELFRDLPLENPVSSVLLAEKYRKILFQVLRAGAYPGIAPGGKTGVPIGTYTPENWERCTKRASFSAAGKDWAVAGIRDAGCWQWFSYCAEGAFAGKILQYK